MKRRAKKPPVSDADLANLRESGLTDATIITNGLRTESDSGVLAKLLNRGVGAQTCIGGLVIPYRDPEGKLNGFARVRPHVPRTKGGKPVKYEQPKDEPPRPYFPRSSIKPLKASGPILIVEGEKKALAVSQADSTLAVIGLPGVNTGLRDGVLLDWLQRIDWRDRKVYILFDTDAKPNTQKNVKSAKQSLAAALGEQGAEVYSVDLPPNDKGKNAVDEHLQLFGDAAQDELHRLLETAEPLNTGTGNTLINLIKMTPPCLGPDAYFGIMGEFVEWVSEFTEATDAGVLAHLISALGAYIGPGPYVWGGGEQRTRINCVIVGPTSTGRKGTALVGPDLLMKELDPEFWSTQKETGLSTGEGLINKVTDERIKNAETGEWEIIPVEKRVFVVEPEFSKVLTQACRDGNILSQIIRESFDSGDFGVLTKTNPLRANGAHITITGHITPEELKLRFDRVNMANGFGNRFLWFAVHSDKLMPDAPRIPMERIRTFADTFRKVLNGAAKLGEVKRDNNASARWREVYPSLRADRPGLSGALAARGESITMRLALLYALLDGSKVIKVEHLNAALAVWEYSENSIKELFGSLSGLPLPEKLVQWIREKGPMYTKDFHTHINISSEELQAALAGLEQSGRIIGVKIPTGKRGRPPVQYRLAD